jgi:hypothetical protein
MPLRLDLGLPCRGPTTPTRQAGSVWAVPRSLAATRGIAVAFCSSGYLDVSVPRVGFRLRGYWSSRSSGLPHSEIPGSRPVCGSPGLIAAYHVLRRLLVPRHPPCAFCRLISFPRVSIGVIPQHHVTWLQLSKSRPGPRTAGRGRLLEGVSERWELVWATCEAFQRPMLPAVYSALQKGGDPAAGSPTATLLRLRPSH